MVVTLLSTVLGFGREVVNARFFGTQSDMDAFLAAATIPTILFGIFNGALVSALVPVFTEYASRGRTEDVWRLGSTVFNVLLIALTLLAALGYLYAPVYVPLVAHGFSAQQIAETVEMTRWLMPGIVGTSLAGVTAAMLNAHHRFGATALQGVAINVVTIAGVVIFDRRLGIYALVLGTALGLFAQLAVQLPSLLRHHLYRRVIDLRHPGMRRLFVSLAPIIVGSAAGQIAIFFDRFFASTLGPGYIAGMNYAAKLVGFPQQVFAAAIATVIFPLLASQFAISNRAAIRRSVVTGLRLVVGITVPAVFLLIAFGQPIVRTLFERGAFGPSASALCAGLLPYAAIGLVGTASSVVLARCGFAFNAIRGTVAISVFTVVTNVALSLAWLPSLGARGLLLANSLSQWMQALLLFVMVYRLIGGLDWRTIARAFARVTICSVVMVAIASWIGGLVPAGEDFATRAFSLTVELGLAALVFLAVARLLGVEEVTIAVRMVLSTLRSRVPAPPENRETPVA